MKTLVLVLATVGLSGCAVYPAPYYETGYDPGLSYVGPPVYLQSSVYWFNHPNVYPRGYNRFRPGIFPRHAPPHGQAPHHAIRDRPPVHDAIRGGNAIRQHNAIRGGNAIREHNGFGNRQGRLPEHQRRR